MKMLVDHRDSRSRGQVLPLFVLMLVALLGVAALAVDVSGRYASQRFYRAVADAAALAGAQDLQGTNRAVTTDERTTARTHALEVLKDRLGATGDPVGANCQTAGDMSQCDLPGTGFKISIVTPALACSYCDKSHAIEVMVDNPSYQLSFAHVLGFDHWNVWSTSVAGLTFSSKYALVTLQPPKPKPNGSDANLNKNIIVSGNNTVLNVLSGDVGTNTSATTTLAGTIRLADNYFIDHVDDLSAIGLTWTVDALGNPQGRLIPPLIQDPAYPYPSRTGLTSYKKQADGVDPACTGVPVTVTSMTGVVCYKQGIYSSAVNLGNKEIAYLESGVYFFDQGLSAGQGNQLLGGLAGGKPGVDLVFPESNTQTLSGNAADGIRLNLGDISGPALPAKDLAGNSMVTPQGLLLTIEVTRDTNCFSGTNPVNSAACVNDLNQNSTIRLPAGNLTNVAGVIYAPSDNIAINGQTSQTGTIGQIVAWTVFYSGGATLNQSYPGGPEIGIVRLDAACTTPLTSTTGCYP